MLPQHVKIQTFDQAEAWLQKVIAAQATKPHFVRDATYRDSFLVVKEGEKVLLKCRVCSKSKPTNSQSPLINGKDMFSPSLRTDLLTNHFKKGKNGKSPHDWGLEAAKEAQNMAGMRQVS